MSDDSEPRCLWYYCPDCQRISAHVLGPEGEHISGVRYEVPIQAGQPIGEIVEALAHTLLVEGAIYGGRPFVEMLASTRAAFEALGLVWEAPAVPATLH